MIDVILCCYNQEKTIKQAVESIYSQKINDTVNVIVADDNSTDRTLEIIKSIPKPENFTTFFFEPANNLGIEKNYKRAFSKCSNDFVFILEGDDWWSSELHIKQHIDFLSNNPNVSMTMNCLELFNEQTGQMENTWNTEWKGVKYWKLSDQIHANKLGNFSGCCFRNELIKKLPEGLFEINFADWLIGIIMAQYGDIAILEQSTSVYRIGQKGQWSGLSKKQQKENYIQAARLYDKFLDYKYTKDFAILINNVRNDYYQSNIIYKFLKIGKKIIKHTMYLVEYWQKRIHCKKISDKKKSETINSASCKIALHFHVFYTDLLDEIFTYVSTIKIPYTLFITVVNEEDEKFVKDFFDLHTLNNEVKVLRTENRGRDIYPFYQALHGCYQNYDIIAHFHTKRSLHTNYGDKWRKYIFKNLIGTNYLFENIINYMNQNQSTGFVSTPIVPIRKIINSYFDFQKNRISCKDAIAESLKVFGVDPKEVYNQQINLDFPCGNMFIAKTDAIKQFLSAEISKDVFPTEEGQLSGTLQHYVELIWNYMIRTNKYEYREIQKK